MSDKAVDINIEDPAEEKIQRPDQKEEEEAKETLPEEEAGSEDAEQAGSGDEETGSGEAEKAEKTEEAEEDANARYMRLLAEFQNYKKRVEKEKSGLYSYANEKIMTELLQVMDNFERALEQGESDGFKEGMEMIFDQLGTVLAKEGLAEITALGEDFDPNIHNAVMTEETDEYESGKVSGVMQKGYTLNGRVIRPSMVKVAE